MILQKSKAIDGKGIHRNPTYRELQRQCKDLGLKAVGKRAVLEARLERYRDGSTGDADYPKSNRTGKGNKAPSRATQRAISYRIAQRVIKYWCENLPGFTPCAKRTGWSNLEAIATQLLSEQAIERTSNTCGQEHKDMVVQLQLIVAECDK